MILAIAIPKQVASSSSSKFEIETICDQTLYLEPKSATVAGGLQHYIFNPTDIYLDSNVMVDFTRVELKAVAALRGSSPWLWVLYCTIATLNGTVHLCFDVDEVTFDLILPEPMLPNLSGAKMSQDYENLEARNPREELAEDFTHDPSGRMVKIGEIVYEIHRKGTDEEPMFLASASWCDRKGIDTRDEYQKRGV